MGNKKINVNNLFRDITAVILIVCIMIVEGCFSFVDLSFSFARVKQITFIIFITLRVVILVMTKSATMLIATPRFRDSSETLRKEREKNEKYLKLRENNFNEYFYTVRNKELKIDAWKLKINKQLEKLEKKTPLKEKEILFKKDVTEEELNNSKYYKERSILIEQLSDRWIEDNYYNLPMKRNEYQVINPNIFDIPISVEENNKVYQMVSKTKSATIAAIATSAFSMIFMQTIIKMVEFATVEGDGTGMFVSLMTDLVFMISQISQGIASSYNIVQQQEIVPYMNRNRELKDYIYYTHPEKYDTLNQIIEQIEGKTE